MSTARFHVQGMDCASCATRIGTAVRRIEGGESVKVGVHTETLTVVFGDISRREAVKGAVSSLGYKATLLVPQDGTESVGHVDGPQSQACIPPSPRAIFGVRKVKELGLNPVMLTGDNRANAEAVGRIVWMEVRAELLPEDKLAVIREKSAAGGTAKLGDGVNDAPAPAAATVGLAMGSGTDVALEAADAAVLNDRISDMAELVQLSRNTMAVIRQNVAIALGLMAVFLVTANALRLQRYRS